MAANLLLLVPVLVGPTSPASATPSTDALMVHSQCPATGSACEDVVVRESRYGDVQTLYGQDVAIDLAALGCTAAVSRADQARCFLEQFGSIFGAGPGQATIEHRDTTTLKSGATVVTFDQVASGLRVYGAALSVVIQPPDTLIAVTSSVKTLSDTPTATTTDAALLGLPFDVARRSAAEAVGLPDVELVPEEDFLFVDPETWIGTPALTFRVFEPGGTQALARLLLDAATGDVLQYVEARNNSWPRAKYYGTMRHIDVDTGRDCYNDGMCPLFYTCQRFDPAGSPPHPAGQDYRRSTGAGACVLECPSLLSCPSGWQCQQTSPNTLGYCIDDPGSQGTNLVLMYDTDIPGNGHWTSGELHKWNVMHKHLVDNLNWLVAWHQNHLGITSGMFPNNYCLNAIAACDCTSEGDPHPRCLENEGCGGAYQCSMGGEWGICLFNVRNDFLRDYNEAAPYLGPNTPANVAHEFTHVLLGSYYGGDAPNEDTGLREGLPEMFSLLYPKFKWWASQWRDQRMGLSDSGVYPLHYALRSRFDWFETNGAYTQTYGTCTSWTTCNPYWECPKGQCTTDNNAYRNREMWWRFIRLLAQGKADFPDEDLLSTSYPGIGLAVTQQIIHDAAYLYRTIVPGGTLLNWTDQLVIAGSTYGQAMAVRYALGLVGFFPYVYTDWQTGMQTDRDPVDIVFANYLYSGNQVFTAYRDSSSGNVAIRYVVGTTATVATIPSSATSDRPAAVEYAGRLYVFWRNASDNSIRYAFLNQNYNPPVWAGPYSLGGAGLVTSGAFSATVFNNKLTLAFVHPTDGRLKVATCASDVQCIVGAYDRYGTPYFKDISGITFDVRPGLSATAGTNVNGDPHGSEVLYVALSRQDTARITLLRLSSSFTLLDWRMMPSTYPYSWRTYRPLGLRLRKSAFAAAGNYLYLTFIGDDNVSIFTSVLQNVSGGTRAFTRPVDTYRNVQSGTGVGWVLGSIYNTRDAYFITYAWGNKGYRLMGYGKY